MTESVTLFQLADPILTDIDLVPRVELGYDVGGILPRRLTIGEPAFFAVQPKAIDDGTLLGEFIRAEAPTSSFYILDLVVTVRPDKGESFQELGVGVRLSSMEPAEKQPIAWSLAPLRSSTPIPLRRTVGLTFKAILVEPRVEQQTEEIREDSFVVAFGLRENVFDWRYTPSKQQPLIGTQQMQAVIKAPAGVTVRADIVVGASLSLPRSGFRSRNYRADLPAQLKTVSFNARSGSGTIAGQQICQDPPG